MPRLKIEPAIEGTFSWDKNTLTFTPDQPWPGGQEISLQPGSWSEGSQLDFFSHG